MDRGGFMQVEGVVCGEVFAFWGMYGAHTKIYLKNLFQIIAGTRLGQRKIPSRCERGENYCFGV